MGSDARDERVEPVVFGHHYLSILFIFYLILWLCRGRPGWCVPRETYCGCVWRARFKMMGKCCVYQEGFPSSGRDRARVCEKSFHSTPRVDSGAEKSLIKTISTLIARMKHTFFRCQTTTKGIFGMYLFPARSLAVIDENREINSCVRHVHVWAREGENVCLQEKRGKKDGQWEGADRNEWK